MGLSCAASRITLVALAALIGAAGSSASAATPHGGVPRLQAGRRHLRDGGARPRELRALPSAPGRRLARDDRVRALPAEADDGAGRERHPAPAVPEPRTGEVRGSPRRGQRVAGAATDVRDGASIRLCGSPPRDRCGVEPGAPSTSRRSSRAGDEEVSLAITTHGRQEISFGSRESRSGPRLVVRADDGELDDLVLDAILRH